MRLRIVLAVLSLLSFLSVSVAGYIYYTSLENSMYGEAETEIALQAERIQNSLSSFLAENLKTVKALGGIPEMREALLRRSGVSVARANGLLDHFREALRADVCYLMDDRGMTIASSNRKAPDSFVGKNFAFRPYWRQAINGIPSTYMALGVASNVRGVYCSYPVRGAAASGAAIGVAVIKAPIERIEEQFRHAYEGIVLLADPNGIVFASNRKEWLYRTLRELSPAEVAAIGQTRQFGAGPWEWTGLRMGEGNTAEDPAGNRYLVTTRRIDSYPDWTVIYLRDRTDIARRISGPFVTAAGPVILALCILIGLSVFVLYRRASAEIHSAQDQMRRLSDSIIAGQEKERAAVSRELHDELGQTLTALRLEASWLKERLRDADAGASTRAEAMCELIDGAIDEVRGLAGRLRPGALDRLGLVDALDWYIRDFEKRVDVSCRFRHDGVPKVDDRVATAAYRIAQESLTNVVRHAGASTVDVSLRLAGKRLILDVEDDGRGYSQRGVPSEGGLGVAGMRERAALIGGTLDIRTQPGRGTRVTLTVPLEGRAGEAAR